MRKLSIIVLRFVTISIISVLSCSKNNSSTTKVIANKDKTTSLNSTSREAISFIFGAVQLRRGGGVKKKNPGKGDPCDCNYCFGLCSNGGGVIETNPTFFTGANLGIQDLGNGTAKLYWLEAPEGDVTVDATVYVDNDIDFNYYAGSFRILTGSYPFNIAGGTVMVNNVSYTHYGTTIVNTNP